LSRTIWRGLDGKARRNGTYFEKIAKQLIKAPIKSLMAGRTLDEGWVDVVFDQYPDCYRTSLILTMPHDAFTSTLRPIDRIAPPVIPADLVHPAVAAAAPVIVVAQALPALPESAIVPDTSPAHIDWYERPRRSSSESSPSPPSEPEPAPQRSGSQIGDRCFHSCGQAKHIKDKGWGATSR
jgi:hypothetical protein